MSKVFPTQSDISLSAATALRSVAVLVEFDDTWGRNIVEAIARFSQDVNWQLLFAPRDAERRFRIPENWDGDGVIVGFRGDSLKNHVRELQLPAVDVASMFPEERWLGHVATNDLARAKMAFEHFRSRQLQHFACYAPQIGRYPNQRAEEFRKYAIESGFECTDFALMHTNSTGTDHDELAKWLAELPKPVGIFASDPYPARQLSETCLRYEIDIPGDIAIISGDEDELLCGLMSPQISSIELASYRIGFEACKMLQEMMNTGQTPEQTKLVDPLRVCSRRSTDYLAIDDPDLSMVVRMIWEQAPNGIQVSDLVRAASMSRRTLEQRFREALGRTPAEEIRRVKIEQARQLIVTTSKSVAAIALECGFSSGPYLTHAFSKHYGITPSDLRS